MYSYTRDKPLDWFYSDRPMALLFDMATSVAVVSMYKFCTLVFIVVTGGPTAGNPSTVNHKQNVIKTVRLICQWRSLQVWNFKLHYFYVSYFRATHVVLLFFVHVLVPKTRLLLRHLQVSWELSLITRDGLKETIRNKQRNFHVCYVRMSLHLKNISKVQPTRCNVFSVYLFL